MEGCSKIFFGGWSGCIRCEACYACAIRRIIFGGCGVSIAGLRPGEAAARAAGKSVFIYRKVFPLDKAPINWTLPSLIRNFGWPKILRLGRTELMLAFALDFRIFGCAEDTPARQCSNKFDIALAYSYLCNVYCI